MKRNNRTAAITTKATQKALASNGEKRGKCGQTKKHLLCLHDRKVGSGGSEEKDIVSLSEGDRRWIGGENSGGVENLRRKNTPELIHSFRVALAGTEV